ncbi:YigZ family protein [Thermosediminibacter litoriperuensis]|uniref:Putative YigZ family protein n=1 Tax=Thermosediminibacter litoriperuensis TaxID=291989 RepID=A0A5S5AFF8_9FIRM|nr:YigZ family protein [Thermosediminibacter litoriperuensis]TYP48697.1 putative YigZ family protein [Thermosediminibacter litoriperuensis]
MNLNEFLTVEKASECSLTIKKSKFISSVRPVSSIREAEEFINSVRKDRWNATHNVYAYCVGLGNDEIQKSSDDGEPSGTAGRPTLEVIRSMGLKNVAVVVSRYFGGTLLGASGLVRAYSQSAKIGLEKSGIIKMIRCNEYLITVDYAQLGRMEVALRNNNFLIGDVNYGEKVKMRVYAPVSEIVRFENCVKELGVDIARVDLVKTCFVKFQP